jgi:hypothetical protein
MAIKMKRSGAAGKVPTTAQLDLGELAINTYDGRVFLKRNDGSEAIVELLNSGRAILAGTGLTGGGTLAADRTLAADLATQAEAEAGTASTKLMTPLRTAQAIAALASASGSTSLSAGEVIRSRVDGYVQNTSSSGYATRHSFDFAQNGTIRVSFEGSSSSSEPAYFRITRLRNSVLTALGTWSIAGTGWAARSLDVDVAQGDRVSIQYLASIRTVTTGFGKDTSTTTYYGYARIQNVRFKTGGENLIPGIYAPVEND